MPRLALPIFTERLTIRSMRMEDHADLLAYRSRTEVGIHLPGGVLNGDLVSDWIAESVTAGRIDHVHPAMTLAVDLDGRVIGDLLLRADGIDGVDGKQYEIGWAFNPDDGKQGYATEAARGLADTAFKTLGVHRVWARLDPANTPSVRVCERLGMRREALFEKASWWHGRWDDLAIYAIRADEWR